MDIWLGFFISIAINLFTVFLVTKLLERGKGLSQKISVLREKMVILDDKLVKGIGGIKRSIVDLENSLGKEDDEDDDNVSNVLSSIRKRQSSPQSEVYSLVRKVATGESIDFSALKRSGLDNPDVLYKTIKGMIPEEFREGMDLDDKYEQVKESVADIKKQLITTYLNEGSVTIDNVKDLMKECIKSVTGVSGQQDGVDWDRAIGTITDNLVKSVLSSIEEDK